MNPNMMYAGQQQMPLPPAYQPPALGVPGRMQQGAAMGVPDNRNMLPDIGMAMQAPEGMGGAQPGMMMGGPGGAGVGPGMVRPGTDVGMGMGMGMGRGAPNNMAGQGMGGGMGMGGGFTQQANQEAAKEEGAEEEEEAEEEGEIGPEMRPPGSQRFAGRLEQMAGYVIQTRSPEMIARGKNRKARAHGPSAVTQADTKGHPGARELSARTGVDENSKGRYVPGVGHTYY